MAKTRNKKETQEWEARCAELEFVVEQCSAAFEIVPIWALERGQTWIPSEEAIRLLKRAKDAVRDYSVDHWHTGNGR